MLTINVGRYFVIAILFCSNVFSSITNTTENLTTPTTMQISQDTTTAIENVNLTGDASILSSFVSSVMTSNNTGTADTTSISSENRKESFTSNSDSNSPAATKEYESTSVSDTSSANIQNNTSVSQPVTVISATELTGGSTINSSSSINSIPSTTTAPYSSLAYTSPPQKITPIGDHGTSVSDKTSGNEKSSTPGSVSETAIDTSATESNGSSTLTSISSTLSVLSNTSLETTTRLALDPTTISSENREETFTSNGNSNSYAATNTIQSTGVSDTNSTNIQNKTLVSQPVTVITATEPTGGSTTNSSSSTTSIPSTSTALHSSLAYTSSSQTITLNGSHGISVSDETSTKIQSSTPGSVSATAIDTSATMANGNSVFTLKSSTLSVLSSTSLKTTTPPESFTPNIEHAVFTIHFDISLKNCENESKANEIEIQIKNTLSINVTELVSIKLVRLGCSEQSKRPRRSGHVKAFTATAGIDRSAKGNENQTTDHIVNTLGGIPEINVTGMKSEIQRILEEELKKWCRSDVCKNEIHSNKGYECKEKKDGTGCHIQSICLSDEAYCRYGAQCEIKVVENTYQPGCRCEDTTFFTFTGSHCEKKSLKLEIALYTAGVIGVAIIIIFLVIILLMRRSGQKKSVQKEPLMLDSPGHGSEEFTNIQSFDNQSYNRDYESNWDMEKSAYTYDYIDSKLSEVNYSMQIKRPKLVSTYY